MILTIQGRETMGDALYVVVQTDETRPRTVRIGPFSVMMLGVMSGADRRAAFIAQARQQLYPPTTPPPDLQPGDALDIGT